MSRELHVFAVVYGAVDNDRFIQGKSLFQCRQEVFGFCDAIADGSHTFREFDEIGIGKVNVAGMAVVHFLLPFDEPVTSVVENKRDEAGTQTMRRFKFLAVHHEAGIARDGEDFAIRMDEIGRDGARNGKTHCGEAVGNNTGVRLVTVVVAGRPYFVGADIRDDNVVGTHDFARVDEHFLRFHGKGRVMAVLFMLGNHFFADSERIIRFKEAGRLMHDPIERIRNIADDLNFRLVGLIDVGRQRIDMDDVGIAAVPLVRCIFDDVVADADDKARVFEDFGLVVGHRDTDGPKRVGIIEGNGSFGHHRVDDGQF